MNIPFEFEACPPETVRLIESILRRKIAERCGESACLDSKCAGLSFAVESGIGPEGFRIADGPGGRIRVVGNDARGLLYGAGKFLRMACYEDGRFVPGRWRGTSRPEKSIRGIYFATHFHNYYHDAPIADVKAYVEDLALWGFNHLIVWFDRHHYRGIKDPAAQGMIERLSALLRAGREAGMSVGLTVLANEGYADSPVHLRADPKVGAAQAIYGVELCPSKPEAVALILREFEEEFEAFADVKPDFLSLWPYDQGGCACQACRPWGANGYLRISEKVARLFKHHFPAARVSLSTWLFDWPYKTTEEWDGLSRAFAKRPDWVDYILADSHDKFPQYPLKHGVPGGLPLINFPEISMWGMYPWGGFGANPLPQRFQQLWNEVKAVSDGGFPYSEGIFADINQAIYGQFYWSPDLSANDALREYASFEYSPEVADDVVKAVAIIERNHAPMWIYDRATHTIRNTPKQRTGTEEAFALVQAIDRRLSSRVRQSWRWRILYLRALLDNELAASGDRSTAPCQDAFEELTRIYHAGQAEHPVQLPSFKNLGETGDYLTWTH